VPDQQTLNRSSFLAEPRQTLLREAANVLLKPAAESTQHKLEAYPRLAAMLASAIEQLRVADDELQRREEHYRLREEEWARQVAHERLLFDASPALLLVSDTAGTVLDANKAVLDMLGCDARTLERMPLAEFVPRDERAGFRHGLTHLLAAMRVDDWRFRLLPRRNVPIDVSATVTIVPYANRQARTAALCWSLRRVMP
jgi:PAS domain S-box-containing protein